MRTHRQVFKINLAVAVLFLIISGTLPLQASAYIPQEKNESPQAEEQKPEITHGPVLGNPTAHSMRVWARLSTTGSFKVSYLSESGEVGSEEDTVLLRDDNSGFVTLEGLQPDTRYRYTVSVPGTKSSKSGSFKTLPHPDHYRHEKYNPEGLFNFSFEHGSCNIMDPRDDYLPAMPTYKTMNEEISDQVDFQIMNGDFTYEYWAGRDLPVDEWQKDVGIPDERIPRDVSVMPDIVGVWENYKRYYERSPNLREWHRNVPAFFMFDDHEILNDINGAGTPGYRDEVALFRDIGIQAWYDYVGWANPIPEERQQEILFGKATVNAESSILEDKQADFSDFDPATRPTLHVHWNDDHKAAGVYKVEEVLGKHQLKLSPKPDVDGEELSYSIGRRNYYSYKVANAEFFVLDTRSDRGLHDQDNPDMEGLTMLGEGQKEWLMKSMKESEADFLFVVSSVSFTIPHVARNIENKDESWTVFLDERDQLFDMWDQLPQPVVLLTGDLHNGIAIEVSDNIHEFVSGPHNSGNHDAYEEGSRPPNGKFTYNKRSVDIQWSSYFKEGTAGRARNKKYYVVFDINNVVHNPTNKEDRWIAYPRPQLVVQYYNGHTGELEYAESILANTD